MRSILLAGALAGLAFLNSAAFAGAETDDRAAAITACRAAIAAEAGVPATARHVDFRRSQTRPGLVETRFRVRPDAGESWEADCSYRRRSGEIVTLSGGRRAPASFAAQSAAPSGN